MGGWLVSLYVCLYSMSVLFLGYVCLYASYVTSPATASVIGLTQVPSVRGLLVVALLNLAGLPPCIFFVAKLGLIVYLLGSTSGGLWLMIWVLLGIGWGAYTTFIRTQLSNQVQGGLKSPLQSYYPSSLSLGLMGGCFFFLFGLPLVTELMFWLA